MNLFTKIKFTSHSGLELDWKVECEALSTEDWKCLAFIASQKLPPFRDVIGVPTGGLPFAAQLSQYVNPNASLTLIADDVYTTCASMLKYATPRLDVIGCVAFARYVVPSWIVPIWRF